MWAKAARQFGGAAISVRRMHSRGTHAPGKAKILDELKRQPLRGC